ncbi:hypothetical protein [uncultured Oscillibacter sp.]|uniref:hypothetical protein n=1 Tax=uncultured Oscillibacter sp. TaxID=876091 RepID=UPI002606BC53|nr:hypothetical protein [uncultured Oscillibacter sp.]
MSSKGSEYLNPKDCRTSHSREQDLREIIECCKSIFNSAVGGNFFNDHNLKLEFFHLENGTSVYAQFCKKYFPAYLTKYYDDFTKEGYMDSFEAQAFINGDVYGILCSLDSDMEPNRWYEIILHELVHIYCTTHEIGGDNFFDKFCVNKETGNIDSTIGTGYALWREFIAYYWGANLDPFSDQLSLVQVREKVREIDKEVDAENPSAKMLVSQILAYIFRNPEVYHAANATAAYELLEKNKVFDSDTQIKYYQPLLQAIFEQLAKDDYCKITFSFIEDLGFAYTNMVVRRKVEALWNGRLISLD